MFGIFSKSVRKMETQLKEAFKQRLQLQATINQVNGDRERLTLELKAANELINSSKFKRAEQLSNEEMERQQDNAEQILFLKVEITRLKRSINHVSDVLNNLANPDCTTDLSDQLMVQVQDESKMYGDFPNNVKPG